MYDYKAVDDEGELFRGSLSADDADLVADKVRKMGLKPVAIDKVRAPVLRQELQMPVTGGKKVDALAQFSRQFAVLQAAGLPMTRSLRVVGAQAADRRLSETVNQVTDDVINGEPLSDALGVHPQWFDEFYVSMVEAGEKAGSLDAVFDRVAESNERAARLRRKLRAALAYPAVISVMIVLAMVAMLVFLIPSLSSIYDQLDGALPLPTRVLIAVSDFVRALFPYLIVIGIGGAVATRRWKKTPAGQVSWDRLVIRVPVFGPLILKTSLARFSRGMEVLTSTGVPVVEAMGIAAGISGNKVVSGAVERAARETSTGTRLSVALSHQRVFSDMVTHMVAVGEESGSLPALLGQVADFYENEVDRTVEALSSMLEPVLIATMGIVVGGMLITVYLPMFRAVDLIR